MSMLSESLLALVGAIETLVNRLLDEDPRTKSGFARLQGKVIALDIQGLPAIFLFPGTQGIHIHLITSDPPDTTLRGTPLAFARMHFAEHASDSLLSGEIRIEGDTALGQKFKYLLDQLDIDWEELVSHYAGDIIAHRLGQFSRDLFGWGCYATDTLKQDFREYVQEEERINPHPAEMQAFSQNVSGLRDDTDRLEARIRRLQNRGKATL